LALIVTKKERNLLVGSKIIKDYPVLQDFIDNTPDLTSDKLNTLSYEAQLFFNNIYNKVLDEASREWVIDKSGIEYVEGNKMSCELCGHRPINNICVIENSYTKKRLKIGTECAEYFGISRELDLRKLSKEAKRIKLLESLNLMFPNIENIINDWESIINNQDIIIKNDVKEEYLRIGNKAKILFNRYCDDKTKNVERNNITIELKILFEKGKNEKTQIEKYVNDFKNNPFAPKKILIRDISEQYKRTAINMIEEDGLIKARTLWRINNIDFAHSLIDIINCNLRKINCKVESIHNYEGKLGYFIVYEKMKKYKLFYTYKEFCSNFYSIITGEDSDIIIDLNLLIKYGELIDELSLERAIYYIFEIIKHSNYCIYATDYIYNEVIIKNKVLNMFYILKMKSFVNSFKKELIKGNKKFGNKVLILISKNLSKEYTKSDIDYFLSNRSRKYI
jgi:hypothetical protein